MYKVYMHITPNNKKYVGITKTSLNRRWSNGNHYKTQLFYRAIKKYGWENIKHVVLYDNLTEKQAKEKEKELIAKYKTTNPRFGYNQTDGGDARKSPSLKTRLKLSKSLIGKNKQSEFKQPPKEIVHRCGKPVICLETQIIFPRIKDASEHYRICDETIRKCCHKKRFTAGGYHWEFYKGVAS